MCELDKKLYIFSGDREAPKDDSMSYRTSKNKWVVGLWIVLGLLAPELAAQDTLIVNLSLRTTAFSEEKSAGYYDLSIPTSSFSSGTYFIRLGTTNKAKTEKIILR